MRVFIYETGFVKPLKIVYFHCSWFISSNNDYSGLLISIC
ncbi:hypothetical protein SAMN05444410_101261 [Hydrobacter penzbergensis]|uniref:Uncharacterized protein n=1 Tax=Hydrobacter penzbergensis TaxID=1235997 RepID=A0A8X8ICS0_9BACT|nr:hypothetical protein SAMN05444410_101261 [Hydrobacter penzbergensis]